MPRPTKVFVVSLGVLISLLVLTLFIRGFSSFQDSRATLPASPLRPKCSSGCGGYKCLQRVDFSTLPSLINGSESEPSLGNLRSNLCLENNIWGQSYPPNLEPISSHEMTGPRWKPLNRRRALIVIVCGELGKKYVNDMVEQFGVKAYRFMLMHYDNSNWSSFPWYQDVISIRFPQQMKWWFIKRFVTPELVESYDYIGIFDEDVGVQQFDLSGYLTILKEFNISLSQPSIDLASTRWTWNVTLQNHTTGIGRWVDFVECGPVTFFSREIYQQCVYDLWREDFTSGWGIDLFWHQLCLAVFGFNRTAIIDQYSVLHDGSLQSTVRQGFRFHAINELLLIKDKLAKVVNETTMTTLGVISEADRAYKGSF